MVRSAQLGSLKVFGEEIKERVGEQYSGVIISDDFSAYNGYDVNSQQKCLAHLRRHAQRLFKTPGLHNRLIGEELTILIDEAFQNKYKRSLNLITTVYGCQISIVFCYLPHCDY
jgi:transposase